MAIRSDSYSSVAKVVTATRYMLKGQSTFNSTTLPTLTEVEGFIDEASGHLNVALSSAGFTTPVTNTTAKLTLDSWVRWKAVEFVTATQERRLPGGEAEGGVGGLFSDASEFVEKHIQGWKRIGAAVTTKASDGLVFTGMAAHDERDDPDDSDLVQPHFRRGKWDAT